MTMLKHDISSYLKKFNQIAVKKNEEKPNHKMFAALQFMTASIIQALGDIHEAEIIHKDIKP